MPRARKSYPQPHCHDDKHAWLLDHAEQMPKSEILAVHEQCLHCSARRIVYQ